jgi:hypothetical protein
MLLCRLRELQPVLSANSATMHRVGRSRSPLESSLGGRAMRQAVIEYEIFMDSIACVALIWLVPVVAQDDSSSETIPVPQFMRING